MTFGWLRNDWRRTSPGRRGFIINDSLILTLSFLLHLPPIRFCIFFFFSLSPTYSHSNARRWWWLISCQIDSIDWKTHSNLQFIEKRGSDRKSLNHRRTQPESINYSTTVFFSKNTNFSSPLPFVQECFIGPLFCYILSSLSLSLSKMVGPKLAADYRSPSLTVYHFTFYFLIQFFPPSFIEGFLFCFLFFSLSHFHVSNSFTIFTVFIDPYWKHAISMWASLVSDGIIVSFRPSVPCRLVANCQTPGSVFYPTL